jgi:hypothetical protein
MNRVALGVLATFVVILIGAGLLAYVLRDRHEPVATGAIAGGTPAASPRAPGPTSTPASEGDSLFTDIFGPTASGETPPDKSSWQSSAAKIALKFALAAFLAALLAFRPRRGLSASQRNPYVAQTQILMAVVAGAMMMVVGDSAARAFGIFAAASLVRFRTNIRDPKEITVLLICLGVGLAAGVGRWDMAVVLTVFVLISLAVLEHFEQSQVFRSMEVTVETRNVDHTNEILKKLFKRHRFDYELVELNRQEEKDAQGKIVYLINMRTSVRTSRLSDEILSADKENVSGVEWDQKESKTYIYK